MCANCERQSGIGGEDSSREGWRRARNRRRLFGIFSGGSFFLLFSINYWLESRAYNNIMDSTLPVGVRTAETTMDRWYLWRARVASVKFPQLQFECLYVHYCIAWGLLLLGVSLLIGLYFWRVWGKQNWELLVAGCLYLVPVLLISFFIYFDEFGIRVIAFIYLALIYIMHAAQHSDPYKHLSVEDPLCDQKYDAAFKLCHQNYLICVGTIGIVATSILLALPRIFQQLYGKDPLYHQFSYSFDISYMFFGMVGVWGLAHGVAREYHLRITDMLRKRF